MSKRNYPTLAQVKKTNPRSLTTHNKDYVYSDNIIGKGSFGKVYLGWCHDGCMMIAVKIIDKSFLKQDPKVKENLDREIHILKLMGGTGCDYVVRMMDHARKRNGDMVIIMEMCDYDLDDLLKTTSFNEDQVIDFLYQLGEGMKALRKQNVVHRDIKPSNILIKECDTVKGKRIYKLADFGFARHFTDDADKGKIMMKSAAGTPVYMAPEALQCVFHSKSKQYYYDDKIDIWSIGALLYKVIVGECGFFAHLSQIYEFLRHKGDAIAFEPSHSPSKVRYIHELPTSVNTRLSEPFRQKMNKLLISMLKLDSKERISFPRFFDIVEDIITSKIELINLLHGTSIKIVPDSTVNEATLVEKVCNTWVIPPPHEMIIFSTSSSHFITSNGNLSKAEFQELLYKSGGCYGHAKLYVLPIHQLQQDDLTPDVSCLEPFKFAIDNGQITDLVIKQRFSYEIIHMIECLKLKLKAQLEGVEKLTQFTIQQIGLSAEYAKLTEDTHQTLAKVSLTAEWVQKEMTIYVDSDYRSKLSPLLNLLEERKKKIQELADELRILSIPESGNRSFDYRTYDEILSKYIDYAKGMIKSPKPDIPKNGEELYDYCVEIIQNVTEKTRKHLLPYSKTLATVKSLYERSSLVLDVAELLSSVTIERQIILTAHAGTEAQVATPEYESPQLSLTGQLNRIEDLTKEVEQLKRQLTGERESKLEVKNQLDEALVGRESLELRKLKMRVKQGPYVEERTLQCEEGEYSLAASVGPENVHVLSDLTQQLKTFCSESQRISLPIPGASMLPELMETSFRREEQSTRALLSMAQKLTETVRSSIPSLKEMTRKGEDLVRIGNPCDYEKGDIAAFVPVMTTRGCTIPGVLHLQCNRPNILMDVRSYGALGIRPGKMPELFFARLSETPRRMKLENHKSMAQLIGEISGDFYRVIAEPVNLKFSGELPLSSPPQRHVSSSASRAKREH